MRVSELKKNIDGRFTQVDAQFVDLKKALDGRFVSFKKEMDGRFVDFKEEMDQRFAQVEERIAAEGEATRRYFDVVAEQFKTDMRLLYDKQAASDEKMSSNQQEHDTFQRALDDHEVRLRVLERPRQ